MNWLQNIWRFTRVLPQHHKFIHKKGLRKGDMQVSSFPLLYNYETERIYWKLEMSRFVRTCSMSPFFSILNIFVLTLVKIKSDTKKIRKRVVGGVLGYLAILNQDTYLSSFNSKKRRITTLWLNVWKKSSKSCFSSYRSEYNDVGRFCHEGSHNCSVKVLYE